MRDTKSLIVNINDTKEVYPICNKSFLEEKFNYFKIDLIVSQMTIANSLIIGTNLGKNLTSIPYENIIHSCVMLYNNFLNFSNYLEKHLTNMYWYQQFHEMLRSSYFNTYNLDENSGISFVNSNNSFNELNTLSSNAISFINTLASYLKNVKTLRSNFEQNQVNGLLDLVIKKIDLWVFWFSEVEFDKRLSHVMSVNERKVLFEALKRIKSKVSYMS